MKQLQALKTSVELKSQAAIARERELAEAEQQATIDEGKEEEDTLGGETQTTAGETTATSVVPLAPPNEMEGDEVVRLESQGEGKSSPAQEDGTTTAATAAPLEASQENALQESEPAAFEETEHEEYEGKT